MITMPSDVKQEANWSGTSKDSNTGATVSNLESSMSFAEHQRIVCDAKVLIATLNYPQEDQDANKAKAALMILKSAYTTNDTGAVYISKGIHQPRSDPHIQLSVDDGGETYLYHLDVSAHDVVTADDGSGHFHWRGVRFSARIRNDKPSWEAEKYDWAVWPEGVVVTKKAFRSRRDSISGPQLIALNQRFAEEEARKKVQSDKSKRENEVIADVLKKLTLTPKDKFQRKYLFEGKAAVFKTKTGKEVSCTYDGTHFTHAAGQKLKV